MFWSRTSTPNPLPVPTHRTAIHAPRTGREKTPHISSCSNIYTSGQHNARYCPSLQQILKAMVWPKLFSGSFPLLPVLYLPLVIQAQQKFLAEERLFFWDYFSHHLHFLCSCTNSMGKEEAETSFTTHCLDVLSLTRQKLDRARQQKTTEPRTADIKGSHAHSSGRTI